MAKSGTPRHSKPVHNPVTIDHGPASEQKPVDDAAVKTPIREAETVGDFAKPQKPAAPHAAASQQKTTPPSPKPEPAKTNRNTGSNLLAGIAGGIIALAGAAALQWGNVIPSPGARVTAEELAHLEQEISALKVAPISAKLDQAGQQMLQQATKLAETTAEKFNDLSSATAAKIAELQKQFSVQPAAGDQSSTIEALTARIASLESQLASVNASAGEAAANISTEKNSITELQAQFSTLQEEISKGASQPDMTVLIAANSLKNAIDRGGSYSAELETFTSAHPDDISLELLSQHAATGIPTLANLNAKVSDVAEQIVATENKLPADAAIWEHFLASAKGLVSVRPVGDIPGDGVGPTTARMESALQSGDLNRAINEWEQLPDEAKAVSSDFATQLKLRRDADQLLSHLITQSLKSKTDAGKPQATQ